MGLAVTILDFGIPILTHFGLAGPSVTDPGHFWRSNRQKQGMIIDLNKIWKDSNIFGWTELQWSSHHRRDPTQSQNGTLEPHLWTSALHISINKPQRTWTCVFSREPEPVYSSTELEPVCSSREHESVFILRSDLSHWIVSGPNEQNFYK